MTLSLPLARPLAAIVFFAASAFVMPHAVRANDASVFSGTELRLGAAYHGYEGREAGTADVSVDALLPAFDLGKSFTSETFSLHPQLGLDANTQGKTSAAFAGFAAVMHLSARFKVEADLGGSINDGKTTSLDSGRAELGCNALFREALGLGYQLTQNLSVMAVAEHMSNANLCQPNNGITNFGLKLGYSF